MTTFCRDGELFEVNGIEFEAIEDREGYWRGFRCTVCDESFNHDPADHECPQSPQGATYDEAVAAGEDMDPFEVES